MSQYTVKAGPEGYLPPASALYGVVLPKPGSALVESIIVPEKEAMVITVMKLLRQTINAAKAAEKENFSFSEHMTPEAKTYWDKAIQ